MSRYLQFSPSINSGHPGLAETIKRYGLDCSSVSDVGASTPTFVVAGRLGRKWTVKLWLDDEAPADFTRWHIDAAAAGMLVPRVEQIGRVTVSEYITGTTLEDLDPLLPETITDVLDALTIPHGDLHCANVLITDTGMIAFIDPSPFEDMTIDEDHDQLWESYVNVMEGEEEE